MCRLDLKRKAERSQHLRGSAPGILRYYTNGNYWTNPVNYDMTLNSERVGIDNCVKVVKDYLQIKGLR